LRYRPWFEDLVWGFVGTVPGEILSSILLSESPFEVFERIRVEKVVWVVRFVWWVERHWVVRG
jgi:hypothetical protein